MAWIGQQYFEVPQLVKKKYSVIFSADPFERWIIHNSQSCWMNSQYVLFIMWVSSQCYFVYGNLGEIQRMDANIKCLLCPVACTGGAHTLRPHPPFPKNGTGSDREATATKFRFLSPRCWYPGCGWCTPPPTSWWQTRTTWPPCSCPPTHPLSTGTNQPAIPAPSVMDPNTSNFDPDPWSCYQ